MSDANSRSRQAASSRPDSVSELRAGLLTVLFAEGDLRYLRFGGVEVVRRLFVGVRDDAWGTIPGVIMGSSIEQGATGFLIRFVTEHRQHGADFRWRGTVEACSEPDPGVGVEVRYEMVGEAGSAFWSNRTGICVLHPIRRCAGRRCVVEHVDGSREESRFPDLITPYQPFSRVRALTYEPLPGLEVETRFEGEVYETEDQRNWSDGSFKTYGPPLAHPFPRRLEPGAEVRLAVSVRIVDRCESRELDGNRGLIRLGSPVGPMPRIGLRLAANAPEPTLAEEQKLRELNLSHLRIDLHPGDKDSSARLARIAESLGLPIEVGLHLPEASEEDLERLVTVPAIMGLRVARWLVYAEGAPMSSEFLVARARRSLREISPGIPVGGGTDGNFAELNRNRPSAGSMDALAYPVCPQVHATDGLSIVENLEALGDTVASAHAFAPGVPLSVGPIRFHRRPDPFAMGKTGHEREPELPDPRQRSAFVASWTIGAIRQLAEAGADFINLYETNGPFGVMDGDGLFPVWWSLAAIGEFAGGMVISLDMDDSLEITGLALQSGDRVRLLVANLTDKARSVRLEGLGDPVTTLWHGRSLAGPDARSISLVRESVSAHVALDPWEIVCLDAKGELP